MTPLDLAAIYARSGDPQLQATGVAMIARGLSDADPTNPTRAPWPVETALSAACQYLNVPDALIPAARDLMPTISDATLNYSRS